LSLLVLGYLLIRINESTNNEYASNEALRAVNR
jgi:hypothetical protein